MKDQSTEKLEAFANLVATDSDYYEAFRKLSLEDKAQELVNNHDFTDADIASLLLKSEQAKDISLKAGRIWAA